MVWGTLGIKFTLNMSLIQVKYKCFFTLFNYINNILYQRISKDLKEARNQIFYNIIRFNYQ